VILVLRIRTRDRGRKTIRILAHRSLIATRFNI
jgi:hypothetical protein